MELRSCHLNRATNRLQVDAVDEDKPRRRADGSVSIYQYHCSSSVVCVVDNKRV
ncbi:hypothetical protein J6590_037373 [Homalodisca vitripennis]|nr:hypothetical protein J6590_037373 [Homalodisca vitripennis]